MAPRCGAKEDPEPFALRTSHPESRANFGSDLRKLGVFGKQGARLGDKGKVGEGGFGSRVQPNVSHQTVAGNARRRHSRGLDERIKRKGSLHAVKFPARSGRVGNSVLEAKSRKFAVGGGPLDAGRDRSLEKFASLRVVANIVRVEPVDRQE